MVPREIQERWRDEILGEALWSKDRMLFELVCYALGQLAQQPDYCPKSKSILLSLAEEKVPKPSKRKNQKASTLDQSIKDRKTSFMRLICKHLKAEAQHTDDHKKAILKAVQFSANENKISKSLIKGLEGLWMYEISQYTNGKMVRDIVHVNKSKNNKWFYLMLTPLIQANSKMGKLHEIPFYHTSSIKECLEKMSQDLKSLGEDSCLEDEMSAFKEDSKSSTAPEHSPGESLDSGMESEGSPFLYPKGSPFLYPKGSPFSPESSAAEVELLGGNEESFWLDNSLLPELEEIIPSSLILPEPSAQLSFWSPDQ